MSMSRLHLCHTLFLFLFLNICFSQTKEIDSLQNLMKTANDTTRVNLLRRQGELFRNQNKEKALELLKESVGKAKQIGFIKGEINGLYSLGTTHGMTGSYAESLDYLNRCLILAKENQDFKRINFIYNSMGIVYKRIGDYPTSHSYYLKCIKLVDSLQLDQDIWSPYMNLGVLYDLMGEQDKAIESYEKALEVYKGPDPEFLENKVLANLAVIDYSNENYKVALDKFLKLSAYHLKQHNNIDLCTNYSNIGISYLHMGQWKLAEEYLQKSLVLAEQISLKQRIPIIYHNFADLRFRQKRYRQAIDYSNKNIEALKAIMGGYEQQKEAHELAYKIYEKNGQLPKAIHHLNQTMIYKDSLLNETKVREIQNLQVQHDVYFKDKEIRENELELALLNTKVELNEKRMIYLGIIAILLLLSASSLYFRYRSKQRSNALLREKNTLISEQKGVIEKMNVELEKRMLRAQMNPHFIFNSLSSIQHLINSNDRKGALSYLSKFSKLLRQVLESSINISLPLKDEIELLKIYVELEALRFDNSFRYTFEIDKNLDTYKYEVPMLLVQPYIENAIIHGLMPKEGKKELSISFHDTKENIVCIIEDNGVGIPSKTVGKKLDRPSRGMSIITKRIEALRKFSDQELITIENLKDEGATGTRVTILIPKN